MRRRAVCRGLGLLLVACAASLGCNATCVRDSDCLGESVCSENRCLWIERRDAGAPASSGGDGAGGSAMDAAGGSPAAPDAGQ